MATTRIMPLHIGKGRTESRAISDIIDYVANPQKTDNGKLITSYGCDSRTADAEFAAMKEYDWAWFCSQRVFQNHTQPIPCEQYDEVCGQSQLFRKFASLSYQWDVDKIDQTRYGWLASVENEQLLLRLKKLSKKDLELLTLLFVDGYRQIDVARLWHCSRSAVAQRFKKIKKFLNNT